MKKVKLTQGYEAIVSNRDYKKVNQYKWFAHVNQNNVYAQRNSLRAKGKQKPIHMHRFILGVTNVLIEVDHRDGNGLNNQRQNLRVGSKNDNQHNQKLRSDNSSGFKGVHWCNRDKAWKVQIAINGKRFLLGQFRKDKKVEAAKAYDKAAIKYFGSFAKTNSSLGLLPEIL